jgi:hypothetical protein
MAEYVDNNKSSCRVIIEENKIKKLFFKIKEKTLKLKIINFCGLNDDTFYVYYKY